MLAGCSVPALRARLQQKQKQEATFDSFLFPLKSLFFLHESQESSPFTAVHSIEDLNKLLPCSFNQLFFATFVISCFKSKVFDSFFLAISFFSLLKLK